MPKRVSSSLALCLLISAIFATPPAFAQSDAASETAPGRHCNASLWHHVYAGDPHRFERPRDRLHVIRRCVRVTGIIVHARSERDGDWHVRLRLDPVFEGMLNARNVTGQHGDMLLEPICSRPVHQHDTIEEGACDGFKQHIFDESMIGEHVAVVGAYVLDMEHGWREVRPVTSITPVQ